MALTVKDLLRDLEGEETRFFGPMDMEVYGAEEWSPDCEMGPGILYVAEEGMAAAGRQLLSVGKGEIPAVLQQFRRRLFRDYKASCTLSRLEQTVENKASMDTIADICHEILEKELFFFNPNFFMTASYETENGVAKHIPTLIGKKMADMDVRTVPLVIAEDSPVEALIGPVYHGSKRTGYLLVAGWKGSLDEDLLIPYMDRIRKILSIRENLENSDRQMSEKQQFILGLLKHRAWKLKEVEKRRRELGFPTHDKYYVLSVRLDNTANYFFVSNELHSILGAETYEFDHYCVSIIGCSFLKRISKDTYPKLITFLEKSGLFAGLSNGFLDYAYLKFAFEQSVTAISLRENARENKERLCRYEDLILNHLLVTSWQMGTPYEMFCHPNVVHIARYDEEHGTEYLKTLTAYVFNSAQLAVTANALFIHRNTLYRRITTLREEFGIDFENQRELMKLRISCTAYGVLGKVDNVAALFGPMD